MLSNVGGAAAVEYWQRMLEDAGGDMDLDEEEDDEVLESESMELDAFRLPGENSLQDRS